MFGHEDSPVRRLLRRRWPWRTSGGRFGGVSRPDSPVVFNDGTFGSFLHGVPDLTRNANDAIAWSGVWARRRLWFARWTSRRFAAIVDMEVIELFRRRIYVTLVDVKVMWFLIVWLLVVVGFLFIES